MVKIVHSYESHKNYMFSNFALFGSNQSRVVIVYDSSGCIDWGHSQQGQHVLIHHPQNIKDKCIEEIGLYAQSLLPILGSIINMIGGMYCMWPFTELKDLHFNNEQDIHVNFKKSRGK